MSGVQPWERVDGAEVLRAEVFAVRRDRVRLPGEAGQTIEYSYLDQPDSVMVVPLREEGTVVLVKQYRYPVGATSLEFPAGALQEGEEPEAAARRELVEELGLEPERLERLGSFHQQVNVSGQRTHVFLAQDLRERETRRE